MPPVVLLLAPFLLSCLLQVFGSAHCACFSQVTGYLDDVICDVETIDAFNNEQLFPKLKALLESDYFRFYKVNLNRPCPFWSPSSHCGLSDCAVHPCPDSDLPESIRPAHRQSPAEQAEEAEEECERAERLGAVDSSLSEQTIEALQDWSQHDERDKPFCVADDQDSPDAQYVDLLLNPERYTGYRGAEAQQVWTSIYEENCFKPRSIRRPLNPSSTGSDARIFYKWLEGQCVEKRSFYRLLSGLHASISIHLSARYLLHDSWFQKRWGHNVTEFRRRFDDAVTRGEGARRLRNLYFLFLTELRALAKALPYFTQPQLQLYTGRKQQDHALKQQLIHILQLARSFPLHFDETSLFAGDDKEAAKMKEDIRLSFLNISRIMDCVGCFKCRLWGKLQTQGLGTALKILFSESPMEPPAPAGIRLPSLQLNRQEVVALLNAFGRISTSIRELQTFRELLAEER